MSKSNANNFSLDHTFNYEYLNKLKKIQKRDDILYENRRNRFLSNKIEVDNMKRKFLFDNFPVKEKTKIEEHSFFNNIKISNRLSNFQHTKDFVELVYRPFIKKKEVKFINASTSDIQFPEINSNKLKFKTLEESESNSIRKTKRNLLPKLNLNNFRIDKTSNKNLKKLSKKSEKISEFDIKSSNLEKDTLFLTNTNNYEKLNIFPNNELRNDLLSSIQNIERMLKTPIKRDKRKKLFQKIYKQDENFIKYLKEKKKDKLNFTLIDYQNNLMNLICTKMSDENLRSLSINLKKLREKNELVKPIVINWEEYNKLLNNLNKIKHKNYKTIKRDLTNKNSAIDLMHDEIEDEQAQKERKLDWKDIDTNKIFVRSNSHQSGNVFLKYPKKPRKLSTLIERISPYLPDYLIQKFLEN